MFTIRGIPKHRRKVTAGITWDNGRLSGDSLLVEEAKDNARLLEGRAIGFPGGPISQTEHLKNPHGAAFILGELFRPGSIMVTGDLPEWPEVPESAIA